MLHALTHLILFSTLVAQDNVEIKPSLDSKPPNIVWISVEDMSPRLGCYGDHTVPTPAIDSLAKQGLRYTHAFSTYGVCAPSRHSIITGMYPVSTGAMAMRTYKRTSALSMIKDPKLLAIPTYEASPPPEAKCFTEFLRAAGYYCTNNSKTDYQFRPPITAWDESSKKAHWKNRPDPDMPFFAVFNLTRTHESGTFAPRSPQKTDPDKITLPPYYPDTPTVRRDVARHYDNIRQMDTEVAKLLDELKQADLMENTIIWFFSDHGDGLPRAKRWVYDSGIHIPMIVRFPDGKHAGQTTDELASFIDFAPTMMSLAGLEIPKYMQGQALLGPKKAEPRKYIYACRDRMDPAPETIRAVRDHRYKYVRNYRPDLPYIGFIPYRDRAAMMKEILQLKKEKKLGPKQWQFWADKKPLEELYDTKTDPHEIHNLASDPNYFDKLAELRQAHLKWKKDVNDLGHIPEDELIKKLWPPDGKQPKTQPVEITFSPRQEKVEVVLKSQTKGASIGYKIEPKGRWLLYHRPFSVAPGTKISVRAHRLGFRPSSNGVFEVPTK